MKYIALLTLLFLFLLALYVWVTGKQHLLAKVSREGIGWNKVQEKVISLTKNYLLLTVVMLALALLTGVYFWVKGTPYEGHFTEWLNLIVRWFHITIGIAWIGASFYFVFLENSLNRTKNIRDELAGNLWAIHGGGFYYLEKYKNAPKVIPKELHWFKYEAYFTWISGFALLWIVYYFNAEAMLLDKNLANLSAAEGIAIGVGSLVVSWFAYDLLCKTPLVKQGWLFSLLIFALITLLAWSLSQVFNSRAAYIHVGAVLGTIMAGNVFRVIIPSQKAMVKAAKEGKIPVPKLGKHAGLRSLHNNYFTLPVLFIMISNHFPSTFGHPQQWAVLAAIGVASAVIKHYLNLAERGQYVAWLLPLGIAMLLGIVLVTAPQVSNAECKTEVSFAQVYTIISERCLSCHSSQPTDEQWTSPPNGVAYDMPEEIVKLKDKIMQRVVITKTMPQNNKTGMTLEEREVIRCWIEQGSIIDN